MFLKTTTRIILTFLVFMTAQELMEQQDHQDKLLNTNSSLETMNSSTDLELGSEVMTTSTSDLHHQRR